MPLAQAGEFRQTGFHDGCDERDSKTHHQHEARIEMAKDKKRMLMVRAKKIARGKQRAVLRRKAVDAFSGAWGFEARYGCLRSEVRNAPLHRVLVSRSIDADGIGSVIVVREVQEDVLAVGVVLLDSYCLGVKNAFLRMSTHAMFDDLMEEVSVAEFLEVVPPSHARKRIDGAIAYARNLGFEPHPDFKDASVVFEGIDPAGCDVEFTYGQDGKPHYISGPSHTPAQSRQIIAQLERQLGPDGFNFTVGIGNFPMDE